MNRLLKIATLFVFGALAPTVLGAGMGNAPAPPPGATGPTPDLTQIQAATQKNTQKTAQQGPDAVTPYNQGVALLKAKQYAAAQAKFEAALKANPKLAQAHLLAAYCSRRQGPSNYNASLQHLNSALRINPNMAEAYESRGVLFVLMGKKAEAQKDLATVKQLNPKAAAGLEVALKTGKDVDTY
jgi:tetratricopeptide (TPR) repeat protein